MMTLEELKQACALCECKLSESGNTVNMEFPDVTIQLSKHFEVGKTEAVLFVVKGWLAYIREFLSSESTKVVRAQNNPS